MPAPKAQTLRIGVAVAVVVAVIVWLSFSAAQANKSYYVTIAELNALGDKAYTRHLRVAGSVLPGSIARHGAGADFVLVENRNRLQVKYDGSDPPPDTFKDDSNALAVGTYGRDGVFHATEIQAKCASKYAPKAATQKMAAVPAQATPAVAGR